MPLFCARLLIVCLVDDGKPRKRNLYDCQFVLVKANGYEEAFRRALVLGRQKQVRYRNAWGHRVRWAFVKVEEIKKLSSRLEGTEVGSLLDYRITDTAVPFNRRYRPQRTVPSFTE